LPLMVATHSRYKIAGRWQSIAEADRAADSDVSTQLKAQGLACSGTSENAHAEPGSDQRSAALKQALNGDPKRSPWQQNQRAAVEAAVHVPQIEQPTVLKCTFALRAGLVPS
jgi:hypothetical protein